MNYQMIAQNALFSGGKYSALDNFCYSAFHPYYTINKKPDHSSWYQPNEFKDKLIEENHEEHSYPKQIKLIKSQSKIRCCKVRRFV